MRHVLGRAGFTLEGTLREAWSDDGGRRHDATIYAMLRRDWVAIGNTPGDPDAAG
jgi:RimJ/RimL family protein N-acetyltransferase